MVFWIDAQLPPRLAIWLIETFDVSATALKNLNLRDETDDVIFRYACHDGIVIITKDSDFVDLVNRYGTPPQILLVTCGNVTNRNLQEIFSDKFPDALKELESGKSIVQI